MTKVTSAGSACKKSRRARSPHVTTKRLGPPPLSDRRAGRTAAIRADGARLRPDPRPDRRDARRGGRRATRLCPPCRSSRRHRRPQRAHLRPVAVPAAPHRRAVGSRDGCRHRRRQQVRVPRRRQASVQPHQRRHRRVAHGFVGGARAGSVHLGLAWPVGQHRVLPAADGVPRHDRRDARGPGRRDVRVPRPVGQACSSSAPGRSAIPWRFLCIACRTARCCCLPSS